MESVLEALRRESSNKFVFAEYDIEHTAKRRPSYTAKEITADLIPYIHKEAPSGSLAHSNHFIDKWNSNYAGYCLFDRTNIIGYVIVKKNIEWITAVEVFPKYRGMGFGHLLIEYGKDLGGHYLTVAKKNKVAYELYLKEGFVDMKPNGSTMYMKLEGYPDSPAI